MPHIYPDFKLPLGALAEFKRIWTAEHNETPDDAFLMERAKSMLRLFALLLEPDEKPIEKQIEVQEEEFKVLKFLHHAIYHDKRSPGVRDIAAAAGFRSSRSGLKVLQGLMNRGFVYRNKEGRLELVEKVRGCDVKFRL